MVRRTTQPSSTVQTISNKIAELTGLNKAGKEIDHVATDQGYIPKGEGGRRRPRHFPLRGE